MATMNNEAVAKVWEYRQKGLSFREIAKLLESDVKQVYRWYIYGVDTYPQKKEKKSEKVLTSK